MMRVTVYQPGITCFLTLRAFRLQVMIASLTLVLFLYLKRKIRYMTNKAAIQFVAKFILK